MLIQFILSLVLLVALTMTWRRARQQALRRWEAALWSVVWIGAGAVIWYPGITSTIAQFVGIGRGVDLVVYGSIIVLLLLVFQLHIAHDRLERQLTELVRQDALRSIPYTVYSIQNTEP